MTQLLTFGHGTAGRDELVALIRGADGEQVVDIRRVPGSPRNPDVHSESMAKWLPAAGVGYRWEPRLGGRRRLPANVPDPQTWRRVESFRAYAAYMRTDEFGAALDELLAGLDRARTLIMCSESQWWRCHRRMVSDAITLLHDVAVLHLGHDGIVTPHRPSAGARVMGDQLVYVGNARARLARQRVHGRLRP
jgi:uncharacterized protein (DUF488 family)